MTYSQIHEIGGEHSLTFYCGELPADTAITATQHEPNGYFWEGVATLLDPELVKQVELDSEAGMFSAAGSRLDLQRLQSLMEPVLGDPDVTRRLIERADIEGFQFDD